MKRTLIQILDKEPDIRNFVGLSPHLETIPRYINLSDRYDEAGSPELEQEAFLRWLEMAQLGKHSVAPSLFLRRRLATPCSLSASPSFSKLHKNWQLCLRENLSGNTRRLKTR